MTMRYLKPKSAEEAVRMIDGSKAGFYVGGGTDLAVLAAGGLVDPELLVDLSSIADMNGIETREEGLWIGASTTVSRIAAEPAVPGCLRAGANAIGSPQIRNIATIGGNICNASPCGDTLAPLVVLGARFHLLSREGARTVDAEGFFIGPKKTVRLPVELLLGVTIPKASLSGKTAFFKTGKRKGQMIAQMNCALWILMEDTRVASIRIAAGSVAPVPLRLKKSEAELEGKEPTRELIASFRKVVIGEIAPIDDVRASAAYRREVTANALAHMVWENADKGKNR